MGHSREQIMRKEPLKHQAYNIIKEKIVNCEYPPSMMLSEEKLREDIQASRTPIRDALGRLEQEGLVKVLPKKGILVAPLSIREINSIHEARMLIEPFAVRNYGNKISESEYRKYYELFQQDTSQAQDLKALYEQDNRFHQLFVNATDNAYLIHTYERIFCQNTRLRILSGRKSETRIQDTLREHKEIAECCLREDWDEAMRAMKVHLQRSKSAIFEVAFHSGEIEF